MMVLKLWIMLLLLVVTFKANCTSIKEQEDQESARYSLTHLKNSQLTFKVTEEEHPGELPNWQSLLGSVPLTLDKLKLALGIRSYRKCLNLLKPISNSMPKNPLWKIEMQIQKNLDFKLCALGEKWKQSIPDDNPPYTKTRRKVPETMDGFYNYYRYTDPKLKESLDCLYKSRTSVRLQPSKCYWTCLKCAGRHEKEFWAFWGQIKGDLRYTFDFVLYDKIFPDRKENQFWYLIAFIRKIAIAVETPFNIYQDIAYRSKDEMYESLTSQIDNIETMIELFKLTDHP